MDLKQAQQDWKIMHMDMHVLNQRGKGKRIYGIDICLHSNIIVYKCYADLKILVVYTRTILTDIKCFQITHAACILSHLKELRAKSVKH